MKLAPDNAPALVILLFAIIWVAGIAGWVMNFQNLIQYWPAVGGITAAPIYWWLSAIGIFVAPLGIFMGWFF